MFRQTVAIVTTMAASPLLKLLPPVPDAEQ
jgi:hypothetical protein